MKLTKIHIGNYRKLKNCIIDFDDKQTIFVGANNSGKTSAMQAIISFLKAPSRFTTNDFTLSLWKDINAIGEKWVKDEDAKPSLEEIYEFLPKMDVWLNVCDKDTYLVRDLIPSFEWEGGDVGVRILYAPNNIEDLYREFKTSYKKSRDLEKNNNKTLYPKNLWDFLSKGSVLNKNFSCFYYVLDIAKEQKNTDLFQPLPEIEAKKVNPLDGIFKIDYIEAQREFSDPDANDNIGHNNLSKQLQSYYEKHIEPNDTLTEDNYELYLAAESVKKDCDKRLNNAFSSRIDELRNIRYPGFLNPEIAIHSHISLKDSLSHESAVQFLLNGEDYALPEKYNGLGYQNLISMYFKLIQFRDEWLNEGSVSLCSSDKPIEPIHLVFIEEPEAHLHAQAQQVFVRKAYDALVHSDTLKDNSFYTTQIVISTHSNHIVQELNMNTLRYFKRSFSKDLNLPVSTVVSLNNVFGEKHTQRFVTRYIKLNHCDFFFADGVILVEGAGERILMPKFLENEGVRNHYISIIEINGSHAHRFRELVERLNIPTLVITDIDAQNITTDGKKNKAQTQRNKGQKSCNDTLRLWIPAEDDIDKLLTLSDNEKIHENVRVAYQTGIEMRFKGSSRKSVAYPYTFEDALALSNIELFTKEGLECSGMVKSFNNIIRNTLNLRKCSKDLFSALKSNQKAPFAINLLFLKEFEDLKTPVYIKEGLEWLKEKLN